MSLDHAADDFLGCK